MPRFGIGLNIGGRFTAFPTVASRVDPSDLVLQSQGPQGVMAILAEGAGFFPPQKATILPFDVGAPARFIEPSDLLTSCELADVVFPDVARGPGVIYVVPVNPSTAPTAPLRSATPVVLLTLTHQVYGLGGNTTTVKSESGPTKVTFVMPTSGGRSVTESYVYTSIIDLVNQINGRSALFRATFSAEGTMTTFAATAITALPAATAGTEPAAIAADWATALNALNGIRVNAVHMATADTTLWASLAAYANLKRLRGFVGGDINSWGSLAARTASEAALRAQAAGLNDPRMMHATLGMNGHPGYLAAAKYAALAASLDPSTPMTFKHLAGVESLEAILDADTEVGSETGLLINGLAPPVPDPLSPGTFVVSRGLSTWTGDDNLYRREQSVLAAVDGVQDNVEAVLRAFLGQEGSLPTVGRARGAIKGVLDLCLQPSSRVRINAYDPKSIVASFSSDTVLRVGMRITPIPPINFADATISLARTQIDVSFDVSLVS